MTSQVRVDEWTGGQEFEGTLCESQRLTPEESSDEVRELSFELSPEAPALIAGQTLAVVAPGSAAFGNERHVRLYTVAEVEHGPEAPPTRTRGLRIKLCVKRCGYVDAYSGERFPGLASNFLCDLRTGERVTLRGPYPVPFQIPPDHSADLILIGSGTGIAPFRAFVRRLYAEVPDWSGRVWMFHGARTGLELLYMNDVRDDFASYYDRDTFRAFKALSPRPGWGAPVAWGQTLAERSKELWEMLESPRTYVYVAGLESMLAELDRVFTQIAGSEETWQRRKAELRAGERWIELVY